MAELKRKIDKYLIDWKNSENKKPLIIKGARQIGKTTSIQKFGRENYKSFIEINFVSMPQFTQIFQDGYMPDKVIKNIKYGIKFGNKNIGFNGKFYTFPYFMVFLLKRFLKENSILDK